MNVSSGAAHTYSRYRRGGPRLPILIGLALALGSCAAEEQQAVDSAAATPVVDDTVAPAAGRTVAVDSVSPVLDTLVAMPAPAPPPARAPDDTLPLVATAEELAALASVLVIPVQGIRVDQLHDTFEEARGTRVHQAIDILAPRNTPVHAATDGRVLKLHDSKAGGLMVYTADASDRFVLMYGHLESYAPGLVEGQALARGQVIGFVGTSGNAPVGTPHLHFVIGRGRPSESWWRATPVNPYPLLVRHGAR